MNNATKPRKRPIGSKRTNLNISVNVDLADVVRVSGYKNAYRMLTRVLAFTGNRKSRVSVKVIRPKKG